jgi:hypothetical protein
VDDPRTAENGGNTVLGHYPDLVSFWGNQISYHVTCVCGKRLKAAAWLAGKRVKCPACGQSLTIPAASGETTGHADDTADTYATKSPEASCPRCRAAMEPTNVLCVHCGYHKDRGVHLQTELTEPLMHGPPRGYRVQDHGDRLIITRGPALKGGVLWAIGVLAIGLAVVGVVWLVYPIVAGILLSLFVLIYLTAIYRLAVVVDHERISVRHEPFFWPTKTIPVEDVEQFYCRQREHFRRATQRIHHTYDVCVLTRQGRRRPVLSHFPVESHALFFEERIEHFLGITDRDVEESLVERYHWLIRFVIILAISIAVLIASLLLR